jgi:PAS domain S-box-containing protein
MPASNRWDCCKALSKKAPVQVTVPRRARKTSDGAKETGLNHYAIVITDADGLIRFWSAGAEKAFGHLAPQAVGQTLDLIVPPEHTHAHWKGFRGAMASGTAAAEGRANTFPVRKANGEIAQSPGRLTLIREPQGQVIAAVVVFDPAVPPVQSAS